MVDLTAEFPFVEWGILVSLRSEGGSRFPSRLWMESCVEAAEQNLSLSMHVCGEWVRQILRGKMDWYQLPVIRNVAHRVQINTHAQEHVSTCAVLDWMQQLHSKQFIIQLDRVNDHIFDAAWARCINVAGLFDCSHGAGVLPEDWPTPRDLARYYGYAGGLGPDNVVEQIGKIAKSLGDPAYEYWIDMEGRVRDENDRLDLAKVRSVLEKCAPFADAD
jgi:hypothetical protein